MTRGGRQTDQDDPERKCIVSGEVQPKAGLIRFCLGPEGMVVPDILARLPGRGFYVSADRAMIDKAAAKGLFSRAARQPVKSPEGLSDLVEALLLRRVIELISLARKASGAVMGYEKVKEWLGGKADVVMSDMAAAASGHKGTDHLRIIALIEAALTFAFDVLDEGGTFVAKVLAGGAENEMQVQLKRAFTKVANVKPPASRADSSEKFVVAMGFRGSKFAPQPDPRDMQV